MGGNPLGSFYTGNGSHGGADRLDQLEDIARQELRREAPIERRKVFISFKYEDKTLVDFLRAQAKNENSKLNLIDMSLQVPFNSENAEYIKQGIRARINQCSVTVVMMTDDTHKSDWVNWEVRESFRLGKGVIVIDKRSSPDKKLPDAVTEHRSEVKIVPWKHDELARAIEEAAENR